MGINRKRKEIFFTDHPTCCFCGGASPATTQDHFPSRAIFTDRLWPVGYVFPACNSCQRYSAEDEILVKFLARTTAGHGGKDPHGDMEKTIDAVAIKFPEVFKSLIIPTTRKRAFLRESGRTVPAGQTIASLPVISASHPRIHQAMERFSNKLFCALHYRQTGKILPPDATIHYNWFPNSHFSDSDLEDELRSMMSGGAQIRRGKTNLSDQFDYSYAPGDISGSSAYVVALHKSILITAFIFSKTPHPEAPIGTVELKPLLPAVAVRALESSSLEVR